MKVETLKANGTPIILIHGQEGRGKTKTASRFPRPLFVPFERGIPADVEVAAVQDVESFGAVIDAMRRIYAEGADEYDTLVFDTLDALEPHVVEHVCIRNSWDNIEKPPFGKGWVACDEEWRRFIRAAHGIRDKHKKIIVWIAHTAIERIDDPRVPTYTSYQPKLHKRARALVMDAADPVFFLAEDLRTITDDGGFRERVRAAAPEGRFLFTEGKPAFAAKNRYGMPPKIPLPIDFDFGALAQHWA